MTDNQIHLDQARLSKQLLLLRELHHEPDFYGDPVLHRSKCNRELWMLDTIAAMLTTGKPEDIFAVALDKRQHVELILAKNGLPTPEDISAADELISLIMNPSTTDAVDLFPFLFRRCGANINKRIHQLHTAILDEQVRNDFVSALEKYKPDADIEVEFPGVKCVNGALEKYGDAHANFSTFWDHLIQQTADKTVKELDTNDIPSSIETLTEISRFANTIGRSRFLKSLTVVRRDLDSWCLDEFWDEEDREMAFEDDLDVEKRWKLEDRKDRMDRLKRRLDKICEYVISVSQVIQWVKRKQLQIRHHWVMDFPGTGEGDFPVDEDAYSFVSRTLKSPDLSAEYADYLKQRFPSLVTNWTHNQTLHARLHPELRIVLSINSSSADPHVHPIGVSKRSCHCCIVWLGAHNIFVRTNWITSNLRGKIPANWALPGHACEYLAGASGKELDESVLRKISQYVGDYARPNSYWEQKMYERFARWETERCGEPGDYSSGEL